MPGDTGSLGNLVQADEQVDVCLTRFWRPKFWRFSRQHLVNRVA